VGKTSHCESIPYVWMAYVYMASHCESIPYIFPYNQFRPNYNLEAIDMFR
jgi:hypothetical protein